MVQNEEIIKAGISKVFLWVSVVLADVLSDFSLYSLSHKVLQYVRDPFPCIHPVQQIPSDRTNTRVVSQLAWNAVLHVRMEPRSQDGVTQSLS